MLRTRYRVPQSRQEFDKGRMKSILTTVLVLTAAMCIAEDKKRTSRIRVQLSAELAPLPPSLRQPIGS